MLIHSFETRKVAGGSIGLEPAARLLIDQNRGRLAVTDGRDDILWPVQREQFYSVRMKNDGPVTIQITDRDIISRKTLRTKDRITFFPKAFVLHPGEEIYVPIVRLADLTRAVDSEFDETKYKYSASQNANLECGAMPQPANTECLSTEMALGVSISYIDIFGDKHQFNAIGNLYRVSFTPLQIYVIRPSN